jgi:hypothetical protein
MSKVRVHEKALAHLSRGLYRSPASALRELVSNAWDAGATTVRIDTSAPHFTQISVQDDGKGFAREEFVRLMDGGIGNSEKRAEDSEDAEGRPTIGRLGIGMLGIAQIGGSFNVTSKTQDGKAFRARVVLYDLIKSRLDENDLALVHRSETGSASKVEAVDVGEYTFDEEFDGSDYAVGTTILANDVHPTFAFSFRETYVEPPMQWSQVLRTTAKHHSLQELGDYWRLLWELSALCPVAYVSADALPEGAVRQEQRRLEQYGFRVYVDGLELRKPVSLKGNEGGYTVTRLKDESHRVFGQTVRFHGYVTVQEGKQLRPDELRGILIRVKYVGVGLYDPSLLDYRINEGPRSRWVTGEVYIDEGLEDALNIDRDSFNRFHPEFRIIQKRVHEILRGEVFPQVYKNISVRSSKKEKSRTKERVDVLRNVASGSLGTAVNVRRLLGSSDVEVGRSKPGGSKAVQIDLPDDATVKTKKSYRLLASAVLAIFDIALRERSTEARRAAFEKQLLELLSKW